MACTKLIGFGRIGARCAILRCAANLRSETTRILRFGVFRRHAEQTPQRGKLGTGDQVNVDHP